jgi:hypothetical protein
MDNIEFNPQEKEFKNISFDTVSKQSKMVGWVVKLSGERIDETQANYVLLGIAVIFLILTAITIMNITGIAGNKKVTYKEDIPPDIRASLPPEIYNSLPSRNK